MDSGRSTPVAMKRPACRRSTSSMLCLQTDAASNPRPRDQRPTRPPLTTRSAFTPASNNTQRPQQRCFIPSIVNTWMANLAAVQSCVLTAVGLSWAVYSRFLKSNAATWLGPAERLQSNESKATLPNPCRERIELPKSEANRPRLSTLIKVDGNHEENNKNYERGRMSCIEHDTSGESNHCHMSSSNESDVLCDTHKLLNKHFSYLMPWVSNQPYDNAEDETMSESRVLDDFRSMSMQHFTELSTAIYRDVRRRERASPSPDGPYPPKPWDQCTRNRQNESRMILCRTINEQFHRLVLALVLEQARRLAEIRIRLNWQTVMAERRCLSPMPF